MYLLYRIITFFQNLFNKQEEILSEKESLFKLKCVPFGCESCCARDGLLKAGYEEILEEYPDGFSIHWIKKECQTPTTITNTQMNQIPKN